MQNRDTTLSRDYRDFQFRLRHDQLLRQQLRRAKQEATIALAREIGFNLTLDDLQKSKRKGRKRPRPVG